MKTIFIPCRSKAGVEKVAEDILKEVGYDRIGLVTTAQFVNDLGGIRKRLEAAGKTVIINEGRPNTGQVLGCDAGAAKGADAYIYIGTGKFHSTRVAIETGKPVFVAHPGGGIEKLDEGYLVKYQKIRAARIDKFNQAKTVGILVSTKPGQNRMNNALELKERLDKGGKEYYIFAANELKPEYLVGYKVDVWVNTGCPRIIEDKFDKPIVDISELP